MYKVYALYCYSPDTDLYWRIDWWGYRAPALKTARGAGCNSHPCIIVHQYACNLPQEASLDALQYYDPRAKVIEPFIGPTYRKSVYA